MKYNESFNALKFLWFCEFPLLGFSSVKLFYSRSFSRFQNKDTWLTSCKYVGDTFKSQRKLSDKVSWDSFIIASVKSKSHLGRGFPLEKLVMKINENIEWATRGLIHEWLSLSDSKRACTWFRSAFDYKMKVMMIIFQNTNVLVTFGNLVCNRIID